MYSVLQKNWTHTINMTQLHHNSHRFLIILAEKDHIQFSIDCGKKILNSLRTMQLRGVRNNSIPV